MQPLLDPRADGFVMRAIAFGIDEFGLVDDAVDFLVLRREGKEGAQ